MLEINNVLNKLEIAKNDAPPGIQQNFGLKMREKIWHH